MLQGIVTLPSLGVTEEMALKVQGVEAYSRDDVDAMAGRSIMIAAQAACRAAGESGANAYRKVAGDKATKEGATDAARAAMRDWLAKKAPGFKVERRDEEAAKAKKVERLAQGARDLGADEAAKVLAALLAAHPGLKAKAPGKAA